MFRAIHGSNDIVSHLERGLRLEWRSCCILNDPHFALLKSGNLKLVRFGNAGVEKPGVLDLEGSIGIFRNCPGYKWFVMKA